jgi:hypothetical protein
MYAAARSSGASPALPANAPPMQIAYTTSSRYSEITESCLRTRMPRQMKAITARPAAAPPKIRRLLCGGGYAEESWYIPARKPSSIAMLVNSSFV